MRRHLALVALLLGLLAVAAPSTFAAGPKKDNDTHVQLLAINDFHGNLEPPAGSSGRIATAADRQRPRRRRRIPRHPSQAARGAKIRTRSYVGAGDLIGATPLVSALFHDEPTIEAMNAIGLDVTAVGNHEFDRASPSCSACRTAAATRSTAARTAMPFGGAKFQYLAANMISAGTRTRSAAVRDQEGRQRQDRLHRGDPQGHPGHRHAGRRRRPQSSTRRRPPTAPPRRSA